MAQDTNWTPEKVEKFLQELILDIHRDFVVRLGERDFRMWEAGKQTIMSIKP
jgi:hypothetical protein